MDTGLSLGRFPLVATRSIDEAEQLYSSVGFPASIAPLSRDRDFLWRANHVTVDRIGILVGESGCAIRAESLTSDAHYCLLLPGLGSGEQTHRGRTTTLDHAVIVPPSSLAVAKLSRGYRGVQVYIPCAALDGAFRALTGATAQQRVELASQGANPSTSGAVARFIRFIIAEADREPSVLRSAIVAHQLVETFLHLLLTSWPHDRASLLERAARPAEPRYLRRAEEYLAANVAGPVSYGELARSVGASVRAIQAAFRAYRNSSPTEFLRKQRFELARRRLLAGARDSVSTVALDCGFAHMGRFSQGYRARFGERPSDTLRRSRSA